MHKVTTHVIYWDPGSQFTSTTKGIVEGFFSDVAHDSGKPTNTFAIAGQYTDSTGHAAYDSTFGGALVDANAYPTTENCTAPTEFDAGPYSTCIYDEQLQAQLTSFLAEKHLPRGPEQLYFVLLPHDVATCLEEGEEGEQVCSTNVYCAYHSWIEPGPNEVIYADIPFSLLDAGGSPEFPHAKGCQADGNEAIQLPNGDKGINNNETRFADVALKYTAHEYVEAVTDPLVGAEGETSWVDEWGQEIGDKCNSIPYTFFEEGLPGYDKNAFEPTLGGEADAGTLYDQSIDGGHFYLQSMWDNATHACLMQPAPISGASFAPPSGAPGTPVSFNGSAFDPYGALELSWSFGDGTNGSGASVSHSYAAPGTYTVTMTPKDALTDSTGPAVSHTVTIAAPSSGGGGGGGGGGTGGGGSATATPAAGTLASIAATPTATVAIVGSTISVTKNGAAAITLSCAGGATCVGKLTVIVKPKGKHAHSVTIGSGSFSIPAGAKKAIAIKLSAAGRSLLRAGHGHLSAVLTVDKSSPAPDAKQTRNVSLSQKKH